LDDPGHHYRLCGRPANSEAHWQALRDIPIGTILYGQFYLPPTPKTSAVPEVKSNYVTQPRENHAALLEDGPSLCLREGKAWKLKEVVIDEAVMKVAAERQRQQQIRHSRLRWMPALIAKVSHRKFGQATITATLFSGMDESLYADFKAGSGGKMAAAR
jgi:hypothetical protein